MTAHFLEQHVSRPADGRDSGEPLKITVERGTQTLFRVLSQAGQASLKEIQVTTNEVEFLLKTAAVAARNLVPADPADHELNKARLRGLSRISQLRKAAEPTLETGEVCKLLGVSRETIRKKVDRRQLFALPKGGDRVFPAFQFKEGAVLEGLPDVLAALETDAPFTILGFLLSKNPDFNNRTAIQLLETGEAGRVLAEARVFLKHGA